MSTNSLSTRAIVAPGVPRGTARGPREHAGSRLGAMLVMGVFAFYFLIPIWWLLVSATKTGGELTTTLALCTSPVGSTARPSRFR